MKTEKYNNKFSNMVDAINDLTIRGFTDELELTDVGFRSRSDKDKLYTPKDLTIVEYHRFEGPSHPGDMSVVYAIETNDGKKSIIVDGYGTYASPEVADALKDVQVIEQNDKRD